MYCRQKGMSLDHTWVRCHCGTQCGRTSQTLVDTESPVTIIFTDCLLDILTKEGRSKQRRTETESRKEIPPTYFVNQQL